MKKLLLIRHAKATHETGYKDFERPLTPTGLHDAAIMAGRLQEHALIPQAMVSSPALRTISTAHVFTQHLAVPEAEEIKRIYDASVSSLVDVVNELNDASDFTALVGHNPGISGLLQYLTDQMEEMATCAVALIEFNASSWSNIGAATGKLLYFDYPKA
ncbi:MAG TPA: histidine phosphatase family protein [Mucilaginibacter sp.]|jgi:phosphohistidine phosphatase|nr:histidine phosphatase family protein [Mucilaginibacter sp.]